MNYNMLEEARELAGWQEQTEVLSLHTAMHQLKYGFTSLTTQQASPKRLLQLIREHWAIENRLHWRRDVTDAERMPAKSVRDRRPALWQSSTVFF